MTSIYFITAKKDEMLFLLYFFWGEIVGCDKIRGSSKEEIISLKNLKISSIVIMC